MFGPKKNCVRLKFRGAVGGTALSLPFPSSVKTQLVTGKTSKLFPATASSD